MRAIQLFDPFVNSLRNYQRQSVIYQLEWAGRTYLGSSSNIFSRLYWWRTTFRDRNIADVAVKIVLVCSEAERFAYEERCIRGLKPGHNKTVTGKGGGVLGKPCTEETKRKIGVRRLGFRFTEEAKEKMSESAKRRGPHAPESIAKAAASNRGKVRTAEVRAALSAVSKGKPKSEAHKAALKAAWIRRKLQSGR